MRETINENEVSAYSKLSRDEIIQEVATLLKANSLEEIIQPVRELSRIYQDKADEREKVEFAKFKKQGGYPADFVSPKDNIDSEFKQLINVFKDREIKYKQGRKEERKNNQQSKSQIIEELKTLIEKEAGIGKAFQEFKAINERWREISKTPSPKEKDLQSQYHHQVEVFYYNMNINKDLKNLDLKKHLELKLALMENIEHLLKEKTIRKVEASIREYHNKWSDIGPVPRADRDALIKRFNTANNQVFEKIREHYKALNEKQAESLKEKTALCEKIDEFNTREISKHKVWQTLTQQLFDTQEQWRKTGRASREVNDQIWERFRTTCDSFFERKRAFYDAQKQDYEKNKQEKVTLCEKAEELKISTDWENTTKALIQLQQDWKKVGTAGQAAEHKLWNQFRQACDYFFNAKKQQVKDLEKAKEANLEKKELLLKELASMKLSDKKEDLATINDFAKNWEQAGSIPARSEGKIAASYTKLLDEKYDQIKMDPKEKDLLKFKNKVERLKHGRDGEKALQNEDRFLKGKINSAREEITVYENNLGFFAKSNKINPLKQQVEDNIEKSKKALSFWEEKRKILLSCK